jgi:hypothetical protein
MLNFRQTATRATKENYQGMMQTVWSDARSFMDGFYGKTPNPPEGDKTAWNCFRAMYDEIGKLK